MVWNVEKPIKPSQWRIYKRKSGIVRLESIKDVAFPLELGILFQSPQLVGASVGNLGGTKRLCLIFAR
jgi:hypothetical protein